MRLYQIADVFVLSWCKSPVYDDDIFYQILINTFKWMLSKLFCLKGFMLFRWLRTKSLTLVLSIILSTHLLQTFLSKSVQAISFTSWTSWSCKLERKRLLQMKDKSKPALLLLILFIGLLAVASFTEWYFCAYKEICVYPPHEVYLRYFWWNLEQWYFLSYVLSALGWGRVVCGVTTSTMCGQLLILIQRRTWEPRGSLPR